jgi:hypothetical protein
MNGHIGNIRTIETANYRVSVDAYEDYDLDLSWDEDGSVREGLESGKYIAFCAKASVTHLPTGIELADDYLGGCIYESLEAFMDHRACGVQNREYAAKGESGRCGSYFTDMIRTVIGEARETQRALCA